MKKVTFAKVAHHFVHALTCLIAFWLLSVAVQAETVPIESPNGTFVTTPGVTIVDAAGNIWEISADPKVLMNGSPAGYSADVIQLAYVDGKLYQENNKHGWWYWNGTGWTASNGACGASNGQSFDAAPTAGFCATGAASALTGTGPWNWTCAAAHGGTAATCSAKKSSPVTNNLNTCVPFTPVSPDVLFASNKKVFAHYFYPDPLSIDNKSPHIDYYNNNYLNKNGEANKWLAQGGFLRQRPLPVTPSAASDYRLLNAKREVRLAIARGITGFTFNAMHVTNATDPNSALNILLQAAQAVDPRFKIMIMPDMNALSKTGTEHATIVDNAVLTLMRQVAASPAAYRLSDGRVVVSPYNANYSTSPARWTSIINQLKAEGISVAFIPHFQDWRKYASDYSSISYGFSDWGGATPLSAANSQIFPPIAHDTYGKIFMLAVRPQDYRPKGPGYWEASNSATFLNGWKSAISGGADWVQIVTWSDYSESSQIEPYTDATLANDIGTGYYNLNLYYATWYLTGKPPVLTHDVLYYFYRRASTDAAAPAQAKLGTVSGSVAENNIELLAFLTAPGTLTISIGGQTYTKDALAEITSFKVPLQPGTPIFSLSRSGTNVISLPGKIQIYGISGLPSGLQDMTYWTGGGSAVGSCALSAE